MIRTVPFKCPHCGAIYQIVKEEAGPETVDTPIACRICGVPLAGREGSLVLKYFLVRAAGRMRSV
jgi:hypothetical protein